MSMNISIWAEADAIIVDTGNKIKVHEEFAAYQTPTEISRAIMKQKDKIGAYKKWVLSNNFVVEENVYAEYDVLYEYPVGTKKVDCGALHIKQLDKFIKKYKKEGYRIKIDMF